MQLLLIYAVEVFHAVKIHSLALAVASLIIVTALLQSSFMALSPNTVYSHHLYCNSKAIYDILQLYKLSFDIF